MTLPTNLAAEYAGSGNNDPTVSLHQQHHDLIHAAVNAFTPAVLKTADEWAASPAVLRAGQFGVATDTGEVRPGDGMKTWRELPAFASNKVSEGTLALNLRSQPGVRGDGIADDTEAINSAAALAARLGVRLFGTGAFRISSTVYLACDLDLSGATFTHHGVGVAVQLGGTPTLSGRTMLLPTVVAGTKRGIGWPAGTVGVKAVNLNSCAVTVSRVVGFDTGLKVYGEGRGTAYCTFTIGHLENNRRNLVLGADANGWANQNTFIGGRYSHWSNEGQKVAGARHILLEATVHPVNNNTWLNPSVEGDIVEQQIDADGGLYNQWINPRLESTLGGRVRWGATASQNVVQGGYGAATAAVERVPGETRNAIQTGSRFELYGSSSTGVARLQNITSDGAPALTLYGASSLAETDHRWRWSANRLEAKRAVDPASRLVLDGTNGRVYLGTGTAEPTSYLAAVGTAGIALTGGSLYFGTDNTSDIGATTSRRPRDIHAGRDVRVGGSLAVTGKVGFYGKVAAPKPVVTGSRGRNSALTSLIQALSTLGLITDRTTS